MRPGLSHAGAPVRARGSHEDIPLGSQITPDHPTGYYIDLRLKHRSPDWTAPDPDTCRWVPHVMQAGLCAFEHFIATNDERWLAMATDIADYAVEHQSHEGRWVFGHDQPHTYRISTPWTMGMAQGQGASFLARMADHRGDPRYEVAALAALACLVDETSELVKTIGTARVYQEYPTSPASHVLNGHIFALFGFFDAGRLLSNEGLLGRFEEDVATTAANLDAWDTGRWSRYDLFPHPIANVASRFYHRLHIDQLRALELLAPDTPALTATRQRFEDYDRHVGHRLESLGRKVIFRILMPRGKALALRDRRPA